MPYISTEEVKAIREEIKKTFPAFKFSIVREHHSSIHVSILSGNIDFGTNDSQVNHYYIKDSWTGKAFDMLSKLNAIISRTNKILFEDGDYGNVPNFYYNIRIGQWDKKYQYIPTTEKVEHVTLIEGKTERVACQNTFQNIEVVEYSEKALAIFGDTKPIKDQLKAVGAKFNPYLTRDGVKTAGWIIAKSKSNELTKVIG